MSKICIISNSIDKSFIEFLCKRVQEAKRLNISIIDFNDRLEVVAFMQKQDNLIIFDSNNDMISSESFVDLAIINDIRAKTICISNSDNALFRFLPINPDYLILRDEHKELINALYECFK